MTEEKIYKITLSKIQKMSQSIDVEKSIFPYFNLVDINKGVKSIKVYKGSGDIMKNIIADQYINVMIINDSNTDISFELDKGYELFLYNNQVICYDSTQYKLIDADELTDEFII